MLKHYFFLLLLFLSFTVNGQIKKQSILLGGQLFYHNNKSQGNTLNQKSEGLTIGLSIGKAFKENKIVGLNFSFSPINQSYYPIYNDTTDLNNTRYDLGAFYREYKKLGKDFYFFSQVEGAFITANQTEHYRIAAGDVKTTQRGGFISLTPGITYQLFKKMQLEITIPNILSIQYLVTKINSKISQVQNSKRQEILSHFNLNDKTPLNSLGIGFRFLL